MTLQAQMAADFASIRGDFPTSFVFGGGTYSGIKTVQIVSGDYEEAGERFSYRFSITVKAADFATLPARGDTISIGGTTYRVIQRQDKTHGILSRLDLGERYV